MKTAGLVAAAALAQSVSAHYIWNTLIAGDAESQAAVRQPINNSPVTDVTSADITCNVLPGAASISISYTFLTVIFSVLCPVFRI
ncbi:hypothetical protein GY45DRAFT_1374070 [Cubamyces sp. BRFM 1775]|nr:hypothetical protein GY45DRAFT_1374070 [Cubamyces sp. BRFM 1775]